jgi:beta-glucanase (GH16 family)
MPGPTPTRKSALPNVLTGVVAGTVIVALFSEALAARRPAPPPAAQPSFSDELASYDTTRWIKADRWTNGSPFDNAWRADHVLHSSTASRMTIVLDNVRYLGEPYSSGEYRTKGFYGYGCYEARFRPIARPGVVTSFFTFAGPYDNGGNGKHNEIDVEFLGKDTTRVQFNFWTNDDQYSSHNEVLLTLGFDGALAAHNYGFRWRAGSIEWYVDGNVVYTFVGNALNPVPAANESLQKIMMNVWPVDATAAGWAGTFAYPGTPLRAQYEWVRYDASATCTFTPNV